MSRSIVIISAAAQFLSFVLLLVLFAGDSDEYDSIERINWAEFVNAKMGPHETWCSGFYEAGVCRSMQADVHLGAVYSVGHFRVHTETVLNIVNTYNVSSYNENCMLPSGGDLCDGCQRASDVIITFQTFSLICQIVALLLSFVQVKQGPSMLDRMILIGCGLVLALFGIIMVSTFHDECFTALPDDLNAVEGSCYVFVSFQIILGLVVAAVQFAMTFTTTTPLPKGSTTSILSGLSRSSQSSLRSPVMRMGSKMQPLMVPVQEESKVAHNAPLMKKHTEGDNGGGNGSAMKMDGAPTVKSNPNPFAGATKNKTPKPTRKMSKSNALDNLGEKIADRL